MKTGWKSLMVAGMILTLSGLVLAGRGPGGPAGGPRHAPGPGGGFVPHAPGPMGPGGPGGGCPLCNPLGPAPGGLLGLAWWLDLTEDQTKQIGVIYEKAQADANAAAEAVVSARDALYKAVTGGATEQEVRAAATAFGAAIGNQAALQAKTLASAKAVLTDEQRKELAKVQGKLAPPRHRGGPMPGGPLGGGWGPVPHGPNPDGRPPAGGPAGEPIPHQP
jgi:Spy/CpxP family protein refolding chaperone